VLNLIDSHVHFWDPGRLRYAWLDDLPTLNRPFLPNHVPQSGSDWKLSAMVFVQADCAAEQGVSEVDWVASLAAHDGRIQAIVAFAPLEMGEGARPALEELSRRPLVKGVRRLIQSEPLGFSVQPGFVAGVQSLAGYGLSCDLCIRHFHLPDVIQLVRQCPQVSFVLDHVGKPDIKNRNIEAWRTDMTALATSPNVMCKLSGLVTEADWQRWTPADLQPYIDHTLEVFGPDRVMYGSDSPVATLAANYPTWVQTLMTGTGALSHTERQQLFGENAARFYRLTDSK
jgi:L-fuconolactonase